MKIHLLADIIMSPGFVLKVWDSFLFYAYYETLRLAGLMIRFESRQEILLDSSTFCPVHHRRFCGTEAHLSCLPLSISWDCNTCPVYCCRSHGTPAHFVLFTIVELMGLQHILSCLPLSISWDSSTFCPVYHCKTHGTAAHFVPFTIVNIMRL